MYLLEQLKGVISVEMEEAVRLKGLDVRRQSLACLLDSKW